MYSHFDCFVKCRLGPFHTVPYGQYLLVYYAASLKNRAFMSLRLAVTGRLEVKIVGEQFLMAELLSSTLLFPGSKPWARHHRVAGSWLILSPNELSHKARCGGVESSDVEHARVGRIRNREARRGHSNHDELGVDAHFTT